MDFKNKKVTVFGLGESGMAAVELLRLSGARVRVTDSGDAGNLRKIAGKLTDKGVEVELGRHSYDFIDDAEFIVVSPGVPLDIPVLEYAHCNRKKIISEIELGFYYCRSPIIAVTGTNGKSTVVSLLAAIFSHAGLKAQPCGNISPALCSVVDKAGEDTWLIAEVSSYQLELIDEFRPKVSVILNFTPDHLEHHKTFEKYIQAKLRIFENQQADDFLVINRQLRGYLKVPEAIKPEVLYYSAEDDKPEKTPGVIKVFFEKGVLFLEKDSTRKKVIEQACIKLKGRHNRQNILAAVSAAASCGIAPEYIAGALAEFKGLPHRIEYFCCYNGVNFIDDSKATNIEAVLCALESVDAPIILIAGGKDKGLDYGLAGPLIKDKVKLLITIGEAKGAIIRALGKVVLIKEASDMEDAVRIACEEALSGDNVLLSPMCSSFDMFDSFKHRGEVFKSLVRTVAGEK